MKKLMLSTAIVCALGLPLAAQTAPTAPATAAPADSTNPAMPGTPVPGAAATAPGSVFATVDPGAIRASDIIGARLYVAGGSVDATEYRGVQDNWEDVGEVNDILLGPDGTVSAVLIDIGGFLGMGERQVAVEMSAIRRVQDSATDADDWFLVIESDRAALENAPEYRSGALEGTAAPMEDHAAATPVPAAPATGAAREGFVPLDTAVLTAEELTGATVYDSRNASVGKIADLVLAGDGRVSEVIVNVGGVLGIGAKAVSLPLLDVEVLRAEGGDEIRVQVPMTKEQLEAMPEVQRG